MGLDIWYAEDIRNALLAANEASAATAAVIAEVGMVMGPQGEQEKKEFFEKRKIISNEEAAELLAVSLRAYREGYKAALMTVALAFGIAPQAITLRPFDNAEDGPPEEPAEPDTLAIPARIREPADEAQGRSRRSRIPPGGGAE